MKYIESPSNDAYFNMALEEYVFEALPRDDTYFMLWQNQKAVVVGRYQNTAAEIDEYFVHRHEIQVVRRLSGGGAMYQDMGNLNFTFVVGQAGAKSLDFATFIRPVVRALAGMGVRAEMGSRNDILIEGRKFSGNSQYNRQGRTMHHGTLMFDCDLGVLEKSLRVGADKMRSKGVKSVRSRVCNIAEHLPQNVTLAEFKQDLLARMFSAGGLQKYSLSSEQLGQVQALSDEKYGTWAWNYGNSPPYDVKREQRFDFGGVAAFLRVEQGRIAALGFEGDFFGNGDIARLEEVLRGCPARREDILQALAGLDVGYYIRGMSAEQLTQLLAG